MNRQHRRRLAPDQDGGMAKEDGSRYTYVAPSCQRSTTHQHEQPEELEGAGQLV